MGLCYFEQNRDGVSGACISNSCTCWTCDGADDECYPGRQEFKEFVKCEETIIETNNTFSCYEIRQIIDMNLSVAPAERRTIKTCNFPSQDIDEIDKSGSWQTVFLEQCIKGVKV